MFWTGLIVGYAIGNIVAFIIEVLCIAAGKEDIDKWMEEDK